MAQKDNDKQATQSVGDEPIFVGQGDEFDDAVTTEISAVLKRAFDDTQAAVPDDVQVTDTDLTAHAEPADDDALASGYILSNRFEIVELVHSGGMAHVYKAIDRRRHSDGAGGVHVAIKMMRPSIASKKQASLVLEREAAKAQTLSHPNIINIFDFDEHDDQFYLVMEWLEGESVNSLLRRTCGKGVASNFAWSVIEGAAAGVQHAHKNDVVHADINPSNIFITPTQDIKLLDFGVARYTGDSADSADDRFAWVTQTYASPEVLSGLSPVVEDDIFSLGCVAYRLLSGKHPFGGSPSHVAKHLGQEVEPIPGLPDAEWQILSRALAYSRSDRPSSVSVFLNRGDIATSPDVWTPGDQGWFASRLTMGIAAIVAVGIVAASWWLLQTATDSKVAPIAETSDSTVSEATSSVDQAAPSAADALVSLATQALGEGKLVTPVGDNAQTLFAAALAIEPGNVAALSGMRAISDAFVQQANEALSAGDPARSYDALVTAAEMDAENPAILIVNQLLTAKGENELADARIAIAAGDVELAAAGLARAEQYQGVDREAIQSVRQQIAQSARDEQFVSRLRVANQYIDDGRLSAPPGDNAHALLLELYPANSADPRLLASMERLGERLLNQAAVATAAAEYAEASELLDAVDALGVLPSDTELARTSLQAAVETPAEESVLEEAPQAVAIEPLEQPGTDMPTPASETELSPEVPATVASSEATMPEVSENADTNTNMSTATAPADSAGQAQQLNVETFGIEKYVAPIYPRRAQRRGIAGSVEVGFNINPDGSTSEIDVLNSEPGRMFASSAVTAVSQWRFTPQEDAVRVRITLRFDLTD